MALIWSRHIREIRIPSGLPPVLLKGKVTPDSLRAWAYETRLAFAKQGYFLRVSGLLYFLDMYFIDPNDHPRQSKVARGIIEELPDVAPPAPES